MVQEVQQKYNGGTEWMLPDGYGRASRGWGKLWLSLVQTVTHPGDPSHPLSSSSTMRVVLLALRLMCMAWFWPVTQLNSSHFPNKRRHKEQYVGETTKPKHGGWANVFVFQYVFKAEISTLQTKLYSELSLKWWGGKKVWPRCVEALLTHFKDLNFLETKFFSCNQEGWNPVNHHWLCVQMSLVCISVWKRLMGQRKRFQANLWLGLCGFQTSGP